MADKETSYADNVPGRWYVDQKCILCSVCSETAPLNFKEAPSGDHDFVFKQPETEAEEQQCIEAMAACPVEAIGNDGIEVPHEICSGLDVQLQGHIEQR